MSTPVPHRSGSEVSHVSAEPLQDEAHERGVAEANHLTENGAQESQPFHVRVATSSRNDVIVLLGTHVVKAAHCTGVAFNASVISLGNANALEESCLRKMGWKVLPWEVDHFRQIPLMQRRIRREWPKARWLIEGSVPESILPLLGGDTVKLPEGLEFLGKPPAAVGPSVAPERKVVHTRRFFSAHAPFVLGDRPLINAKELHRLTETFDQAVLEVVGAMHDTTFPELERPHIVGKSLDMDALEIAASQHIEASETCSK